MVAAEPPQTRQQALAQLLRAASALGVNLAPESADRFQVYLDTLFLWRTRLSLTAASTAQDIVERHMVDSLSVVRFVRPGYQAADIGSGAGFPGIPLAISCPQARVILVESRRKRANFLREVVRCANLTNAEVLEARAESLVVQYPAAFDVVVSRALGPAADFLRLAANLLKTGGLAIAMKGPKGRGDTVPPDGFAAPDIVPYALAGDIPRLLMVYRRL